MTQAQVYAFEGGAGLTAGRRDLDLIERAKHGREEFGLLYERYCPMLLNYVHRRTGDVHATEDLVADVFVIVMRSLPGYRQRNVPLRHWLFRIATNTVNRWARRQRRRACASLDADRVVDTGGRSTSAGMQGEHMQRALLSLPPRYQAVLSLHHLEGLSVKETAAILGCREGTVRSRLARARNALRDIL